MIIQMQGGLGNQLFYYGLYKQLQSLGREVYIDDITGFEGDAQRTPQIYKLGIEYNRATIDMIKKMRDSLKDPYHIARRKLFGRRGRDYFEPEDGNFDAHILEKDDIYLTGYFQSPKYFADSDVKKTVISDILQKKDDYLKNDNNTKKESIDFKSVSDVKKLHSENEADFEQLIITSSDKALDITENVPSVSLHVRRGDYLFPGIKETYEGICTDEYYDKAIAMILKKEPSAVFICFSNDIDYCAGKYKDRENFKFVSIKGEDADIKEFFLMSMCKHHIMANSSFSFWSAFVSEKSGLTIAPHKWLNNKNMTDIYTEDMIKI